MGEDYKAELTRTGATIEAGFDRLVPVTLEIF
jgi:hypothetical protein